MGAICRVLPNSNAFSRSEHISAKPVSELLVQDQRIYIYIINLMLNLTVATNLLRTLLRITLFSKDSEKVTEKNIFIVTVPSSFRQGLSQVLFLVYMLLVIQNNLMQSLIFDCNFMSLRFPNMSSTSTEVLLFPIFPTREHI